MRYAIFTDVHANLEALEAVLAKIDELSQEEPIDQIWFLGDLVGYGPNPNECIQTLRARTDVIIAGNHDWAAVGKIDLEDFSEAARISAEWTAQQLTEEHREFLANRPERIEREDCILVHGSPYGPLWEYLTSEVLAERSFEHFSQRYCFVGHTHVPVIFQQPYDVSQEPTVPLDDSQANNEGDNPAGNEDDDDTAELVAVRPPQQTSQSTTPNPSASLKAAEDAADTLAEMQQKRADNEPELPAAQLTPQEARATPPEEPEQPTAQDQSEQSEQIDSTEEPDETVIEVTPEEEIKDAEERLNEEIEELLSLLGLSQSLVSVTNEMIIPPEGHWKAPDNYRAIINPGGVGQPRDGNPRAAFMIYDTEQGFTFYRIDYPIEKTQQKIIEAGLPPYLATRLAYGR
jgi:diadenosine tetraphosphatase ApaH/serine/threonine PP2A family protein phosphatase